MFSFDGHLHWNNAASAHPLFTGVRYCCVWYRTGHTRTTQAANRDSAHPHTMHYCSALCYCTGAVVTAPIRANRRCGGGPLSSHWTRPLGAQLHRLTASMRRDWWRRWPIVFQCDFISFCEPAVCCNANWM